MAQNKEDCIKLLQSAINLLHDSEKWCSQAFIKAQMLGLQGEKRRERHEARKGYMLMQYLQGVAVDLFDTEIYPANSDASLPAIPDIPSYFNQYLMKLWKEYEGVHMIANELVVKGYRKISEQMYCYTDCLFAEIIDTRRTIKENTLANWEYLPL